MRSLSLLLLAILVGCAHHSSAPTTTAYKPNTIYVDQQWHEAIAIARRLGYELHDASQLAKLPSVPQEGFYIELPGQRGLIVFVDGWRDTVKSMKWEENWPGPKANRIDHEVEWFDVPPAEKVARE